MDWNLFLKIWGYLFIVCLACIAFGARYFPLNKYDKKEQNYARVYR
jgi:cytochrome c oxidase subunit IV